METGTSSSNHHALQQELHAVTDIKTRLTIQMEGLQRELAQRHLQHPGSSAVDTGRAAADYLKLEKENKLLRAQIVMHLEREERRQRQQQQQQQEGDRQAHTFQSSVARTECSIDSVRLPTIELLRAVRATFGPGRVALDDGTSVSLEYVHDHIVVRGPQTCRNAFVAQLLHAVLKQIDGAVQLPQRRDGDEKPHNVSTAPAEPPALVGGGLQAKGSVASPLDSNDGCEQLLHALRRALDIERVECEKARIALHDAEHECALKEAALRTKDARHTEEKQRLEERVRQLELDLGRKKDSLHIALNRLQEREQQPQQQQQQQWKNNCSTDMRGQVAASSASPPLHDTDLDALLEQPDPVRSHVRVVAATERHDGRSGALCRTPQRSGRSRTNNGGNGAAVGGSPSRGETQRRESLEEAMVFLQREMELLRENKERLSRQLELSTEVAQQQCDRMRSVECATHHLCRVVLSSSELATAAVKGAAAEAAAAATTTTTPRIFLYRGGTENARRVWALVQTLSSSAGGDVSVEQRLTGIATLLELQHSAQKATLDFALHERDAALQAQREEALLRGGSGTAAAATAGAVASSLLQSGGAVSTTTTTAATEAGGLRPADGKVQVALERENVALRRELQQCFEDMRKLGRAVAQAQTQQQALQNQLRVSERHVREKEEAMRYLEQRQRSELLAAKEQERSLELRLRKLQQQRKQEEDASHPPAGATYLYRAPRGAAAHLVTTPSHSNHAVSTNTTTLNDSRNNNNNPAAAANNNSYSYNSNTSNGYEFRDRPNHSANTGDEEDG